MAEKMVPASARASRSIFGALGLLALAALPAAAQDAGWPPHEERSGTLPDGTAWLIRVPEDWNGTLLRDLDFATGVKNYAAGRYRDLLARGYAFAGLARHPLRLWQYDPAREIANMERVEAIFAEQGRSPDWVNQYGCSGGGHDGLAVAEDFPEGVAGAVVLAAHTPVWIMSSYLDGWFAMLQLLGPAYEEAGLGPAGDLQIVNLPNAGSPGRSLADIESSWRAAIQAARETPERRARLALAFAIGQWSPWPVEGAAMPDPADPQAMAEAVVQSALRIAGRMGGTSRLLFENAASGQQPSGNEGVDYAAFYENAPTVLKDLVGTLYDQAELDLEADLARIEAAPRIAASDYALDFWSEPGRTVTGDLQIPVIRMHMLGDNAVPYSLMYGYEALAQAEGKGDLYRQALVRATGHCEFTAAESTAAVEALVERLETGVWPDTSPEALNARADALATGTESRFMPEND